MKALYVVATLYLIALGIFVSQPPVVAEVKPISPYALCERETYASKIHCETNQHREQAGMATLAYSTQAENVAKERAVHLCETNTFTHDGWEGFLDIEYTKAGENLAKGFVSPSDAFEALLASPTHKENIEGDWNAMGVYTESCGGLNITVQIFTSI